MTGAALVGLPPLDPTVGFASDPSLANWTRAVNDGSGLVTVAERNAIVAQLAWAQSILATTPAGVRRLPNGTPFPFGVSLARELELGTQPGDYQPGDIVLPTARSAGAATATAAPPAMTTITNAQRQQAFEATQRALALLALRPGQIVLVPAGAAPAGYLLAGVAVVCVGIAAYAAYSAYVNAEVVRSGAETAQVRIREEQGTARVVAQVNAQTQALAARLAHAQRTGQLPPPSPIELRPIELPRSTPSSTTQGSFWSWVAGLTVLGAGGGAAAYYGGRKLRERAMAL